MSQNRGRAWNIFVAISVLLGSIFFGTYKRTLSSSLGEIQNDSRMAGRVSRTICKVLDRILSDEDHCEKEYNDYLREVNK
jgi:hypothetical protein